MQRIKEKRYDSSLSNQVKASCYHINLKYKEKKGVSFEEEQGRTK